MKEEPHPGEGRCLSKEPEVCVKKRLLIRSSA